MANVLAVLTCCYFVLGLPGFTRTLETDTAVPILPSSTFGAEHSRRRDGLDALGSRSESNFNASGRKEKRSGPGVKAVGSPSVYVAEGNIGIDGSLAAMQSPQNVSGMYRGTWTRLNITQPPGSAFIFGKNEGVVIFELRTTASKEHGMENVQGDLVLRNGIYVTDTDIRLRLHGVLLKETGRIEANLEPLTPIRVDISGSDIHNGNADYRSALRDTAGWTFANLGRSSMRSHALGKTGGELAMKKKCEFRIHLDSNMTSLAHAGSSSFGGHSLPGHDSSDPTLAALQSVKLQDEEAANMSLKGTLISENCGISMTVNASYIRLEEYYAKAVNYTLMITMLSFMQVLLVIRQMESTNTQANAAKVSLLSIGIQAIMDAYLCLLHLTAGIVVEALFNAFATAAFFEFVMFAVFEMRYLLAIWRARRSGSFDPVSARRDLSILYTRFYGALLLVIFLAYQLQRFVRSFIFILYSFWLPQILYCIRSDLRQPLRPLYILGISATRLALPLYLYGCPKNLLRVAVDYRLCVSLVIWMGIQVAVLMLQSYFGPRCIIPKRFLPAKYDYFKIEGRNLNGGATADLETGREAVECVICMTPIEDSHTTTLMVTPCQHFFHSGCLQRWMDIKMECPTCRRSLPPP